MAQKISELMTPAPVAVRSSQPVAGAATAMREHRTGERPPPDE